MARVVFFHGLNTYGDDDLHLGHLNFGSMNTPWENALRKHGFEVFSPPDLKYHPVTDQAEMAVRLLRDRGWLEQGNLFLLGHSSGGLIARVLSSLLASQNETKGKVTGVLTVGTPHYGLAAAEFAIALSDPTSRAGRCLRMLGYNLQKRAHVFERYLDRKMEEFNAHFPITGNHWEGYALCEASLRQLSWPLLLGYKSFHKNVEHGKSDGFVSSKSQAWGKQLGRYELDHLNNLGFFFQPLPGARKRAKAEFERLALDVAILAKSLATDNPKYASV